MICRHEPLLSDTTDADDKFGDRATTYLIDEVEYTGVFSTDLTLEEVKTLRAVQPNELRDPKYDGMFEVRARDTPLRLLLPVLSPNGTGRPLSFAAKAVSAALRRFVCSGLWVPCVLGRN
jgi:hypothetical protein